MGESRMRKRRRERVLTEVLRLRGEVAGPLDPTRRNELLADMVWEAATTGVLTFPETKVTEERHVKLSARDWRDLTSWIYSQIDGPASTAGDADDEVSILLKGSSREELLGLIQSVAASSTDGHQSQVDADAQESGSGARSAGAQDDASE